MNVLPSKQRQQGSHALLVAVMLLVVAAIGLIGWRLVTIRRAAQTPAARTTTQTKTTPVQPIAVHTFYDCFDVTGQFAPGMPPTCGYQDQTFTRPADFTEDDVRGLSKVPASAKPTVLAIAKRAFDVCKDVPDLTSVTRIYNAIDDSFVYLGTGCDSGYREILVHQQGAWIETAHSQGSLSCSDVDTYHIPKALVHEADMPSSDTCYTADGKTRQLY